MFIKTEVNFQIVMFLILVARMVLFAVELVVDDEEHKIFSESLTCNRYIFIISMGNIL